MTPQQIDELIRRANTSRYCIEAILDAAKRFENFPLSDQDNDVLVNAYNTLRGVRKDLHLLLMKAGAQSFIRNNQK